MMHNSVAMLIIRTFLVLVFAFAVYAAFELAISMDASISGTMLFVFMAMPPAILVVVLVAGIVRSFNDVFVSFVKEDARPVEPKPQPAPQPAKPKEMPKPKPVITIPQDWQRRAYWLQRKLSRQEQKGNDVLDAQRRKDVQIRL